LSFVDKDSIFKRIKKVGPGHIIIAKNGEIAEKEYWDLIVFQIWYFHYI